MSADKRDRRTECAEDGARYSASSFAVSSLGLHFLPNAALLLPVVQRFAVNLMNRGFCDPQFIAAHRHQKIDIVHSAVDTFHIDVPCPTTPKVSRLPYNFMDRRRSAFAITDTELKLMAAPAIIGLRRTLKNG